MINVAKDIIEIIGRKLLSNTDWQVNEGYGICVFKQLNWTWIKRSVKIKIWRKNLVTQIIQFTNGDTG